MKHKDTIIKLRLEGKSLGEIQNVTGAARSTIWHHISKLAVPKQYKKFKHAAGVPIRIIVGSPRLKKDRMRSGDYLIVRPPKGYVGRMHSRGYAYEHHVVWWERTQSIVEPGMILHHRNHDKHDNRFENLELMTASQHAKHHAKERLLAGIRVGSRKRPVKPSG